MTQKVVRLLKPHTHNEIKRLPGAKLTLPERIADWLVHQGIAEPATEGVTAFSDAPKRIIRPGGCCGGRW